MPKDVGVENEQDELNIWCKQTNRTKTEQNIEKYRKIYRRKTEQTVEI